MHKHPRDRWVDGMDADQFRSWLEDTHRAAEEDWRSRNLERWAAARAEDMIFVDHRTLGAPSHRGGDENLAQSSVMWEFFPILTMDLIHVEPPDRCVLRATLRDENDNEYVALNAIRYESGRVAEMSNWDEGDEAKAIADLDRMGTT